MLPAVAPSIPVNARSTDRATLDSLLRTLQERAGYQSAAGEAAATVATGWGVDLPRGVVHEWFAGAVEMGADGDDARAESDAPPHSIRPGSPSASPPHSRPGSPPLSRSGSPPGSRPARGEGAVFPPLLVLAHLARQAMQPVTMQEGHSATGIGTGTGTGTATGMGAVLWIGRACFPTVRTLTASDSHSPIPSAGRKAERASDLLSRSLFIDPPDDASRLWAIDLAARSPGVGVVIADGRRLDMAASRRLQLAAQARQRSNHEGGEGVAGGPLVLLARPARELNELSAAATRWVVVPARSPSLNPTWTVQLLRCKGLRPAGRGDEASRRMIVECDHATGVVHLSADLRDRSDLAAGASRDHPGTGERRRTA